MENRFYLKKKKQKTLKDITLKRKKTSILLANICSREIRDLSLVCLYSIKYRKVQDLLSKRSRMKKNGKEFL